MAITISGCLNNNHNSNDNQITDESIIKIYYEFELIPSNTSEYYIYLPVPLTAPAKYENKPSDIINEIKIEKGNAEYELIQSEKGLALNISSDSHVLLTSQFEFNRDDWNKYSNYTFSMLSLPKEDNANIQFIYFNSNLLETIYLNFYCYNRIIQEKGSENLEYGTNNTIIHRGWQELNLLIDHTVSD